MRSIDRCGHSQRLPSQACRAGEPQGGGAGTAQSNAASPSAPRRSPAGMGGGASAPVALPYAAGRRRIKPVTAEASYGR